ncbi:MAG TPA: HEAT repeat domain-containing protein [Planctomycetota bacterium]|nr:HEAT repeat domain-containing protein [Planctomycetota bacterium]
MRVLLWSLLFALPAAGEPDRAYLTELGRRVLSRSDQIVEAKVVKLVPPFRGISTAQLAVTSRLAGYDREPVLVLLYTEDYAAPDAFTATLDSSAVQYERERRAGLDKYLSDVLRLKVPKAEQRVTGTQETKEDREQTRAPRRGSPGIRLAEGEEGIFFLRRQATSYALVGLIPRGDPLYESKEARLKDVLAVESISPFDRRADNAKHLFLETLGSDDLWIRGNSARELAALAGRYKDLFTEADATRLAALLVAEQDPAIRASLERAAGAVDRKLADRYAKEAEERGRARYGASLEAEAKLIAATRIPELRASDLMRVARTYGRAATQLLSGYLADPDAIVREYAANGLAEQGAPTCDPPLRQALEKEQDRDAATAMMYALGVHGDRDAVPVLAARLGDAAIERAAIHALARIGTPDARVALEKHAKGASAETQDLIASLIREEFAERR